MTTLETPWFGDVQARLMLSDGATDLACDVRALSLGAGTGEWSPIGAPINAIVELENPDGLYTFDHPNAVLTVGDELTLELSTDGAEWFEVATVQIDTLTDIHDRQTRHRYAMVECVSRAGSLYATFIDQLDEATGAGTLAARLDDLMSRAGFTGPTDFEPGGWIIAGSDYGVNVGDYGALAAESAGGYMWHGRDNVIHARQAVGWAPLEGPVPEPRALIYAGPYWEDNHLPDNPYTGDVLDRDNPIARDAFDADTTGDYHGTATRVFEQDPYFVGREYMRVSPGTTELTTRIPVTPGAQYRLEYNVADDADSTDDITVTIAALDYAAASGGVPVRTETVFTGEAFYGSGGYTIGVDVTPTGAYLTVEVDHSNPADVQLYDWRLYEYVEDYNPPQLCAESHTVDTPFRHVVNSVVLAAEKAANVSYHEPKRYASDAASIGDYGERTVQRTGLATEWPGLPYLSSLYMRPRPQVRPASIGLRLKDAVLEYATTVDLFDRIEFHYQDDGYAQSIDELAVVGWRIDLTLDQALLSIATAFPYESSAGSASSAGSTGSVIDSPPHGHSDYMEWQSKYDGSSYERNDVVRDGAWTMVANTDTTDRPAPVPVGDPAYATQGAPWTTQGARANQDVRNRYTMLEPGWFDQLAVRVESPELVHTVAIWVDGELADTLTWIPQTAGVAALSINPVFVASGDVVEVSLQIPEAAAQYGDSEYAESLGWFATLPAWVSAAHGSDDGGATWTDAAYGVDAMFQDATVSPDWDLLAYTGAAGGGSGGGGELEYLGQLTDVEVTGATDGQVLTYDAASGVWIAANVDSGGDHDHDADYVEVTGDTMSGPLKLAAGSAAAPVLSWTLNVDMGFFRVSNNRVGISSQGVQRASLGAGWQGFQPQGASGGVNAFNAGFSGPDTSEQSPHLAFSPYATGFNLSAGIYGEREDGNNNRMGLKFKVLQSSSAVIDALHINRSSKASLLQEADTTDRTTGLRNIMVAPSTLGGTTPAPTGGDGHLLIKYTP